MIGLRGDLPIRAVSFYLFMMLTMGKDIYIDIFDTLLFLKNSDIHFINLGGMSEK